ncbi:MAG: Mov34/MPN/PAD-1 family protein [Waterburya sp.]
MLLSHSVAGNLTNNLPTDFIWAGNGIFRSVSRREFKAVVSHREVHTPGLPEFKQEFKLLVPPVPQKKVEAIIEQIQQEPDLEQLFYLYWRGDRWEVLYPEQECTPSTCIAGDQFPEPAVIEIHSHGAARAFFSGTDDLEEDGCRISTVIGRSNGQLEIISRVCVHGLFLPIQSSLIYENVSLYCNYVLPF